MTFGSHANAAELDELDSAILRVLQQNARTTLADVGRAAGLAASSVHERLRRLQRDGVVRGWTLDLDPTAVGRPVTAFVGVEANPRGGPLVDAFRRMPLVDECHNVAGEMSFLLKVRAAGTSELSELVDQLGELTGVRRTLTTVVLRTEFERRLVLAPRRQEVPRPGA
ncbi:MAG TPA: Lrp/AsnC family transcriptional regulator [Verrucomicrobiae bacterium]|nr:Lrp/AsnC family transcriptional regulator [Verrucomicrobiae bacterium]